MWGEGGRGVCFVSFFSEIFVVFGGGGGCCWGRVLLLLFFSFFVSFSTALPAHSPAFSHNSPQPVPFAKPGM